MAIRTFLQGLGATHLFDLDNNGLSTTDDLGNSSTLTSLTLGANSSFVTTPVCEGVTHSLQTTNNTSMSIAGAEATNVADINQANKELVACLFHRILSNDEENIKDIKETYTRND